MKEILESLQNTIKLVQTEKNKAVKEMNYEKAGMLRDLEKNLLGKESCLQSDMLVYEGW